MGDLTFGPDIKAFGGLVAGVLFAACLWGIVVAEMLFF